MKKHCIILLSLLLIIASPLLAEEVTKKTLIVYYSQTGKNKLIAEYLNAQIQNSEVQQIKIKEEIGFGSLIFKHIVRGSLPIEPIDAKDYDAVVLSTPIWLQMLSLPAKEFIEHTDLKGKEVYAFITCGGFYGFADSISEWIATKTDKATGVCVIKVGGKTDDAIKGEISTHLKNTSLLQR